jgi:hypothetical protein
MRINIWVPDEELKIIDAACELKKMSRSGYLIYCATHDVKEKVKEIKGDKEDLKLCKHGSMKGLCRYGCK